MKDSSYEEGENIYKQGDTSQHLFIIMTGRIELSRQNDDEEESWGLLQKGDVFGFEAWREYQPRMFSAKAVEDSRVLYLDMDRLFDLAEEAPVIRDYLQLMLDGYGIMLGLKLEWREPDEPIYYISRVHQVILFGRGLPSP